MFIDDTIAAIATAPGEGGIGIIRISGPKSLEVAEEIFFSMSGKKISEYPARTLIFGNIKDGDKKIDEVLVAYMKGPNSYTAEDVIEINCHGGFISVKRILELVLSKDVRLAEAGEFTKRAFLNGRIDLTQAEAVIDLIHGKTEKSVSLSLNQLRGDLKEQIEHLKKLVLDVAAHINVVLDYPEEGIDDPLPEHLVENLQEVLDTTDRLIKSYDKGKMIKEGIKTAIVGKPNVGKSSILNSVLKEERAIVTHVAGTTRDVIEEVVNLKGIPLVLVDTAGIRKTDDLVENIGVEKSKKLIESADLILFVVDGSRPLDEEDMKIHEAIKAEKVIGILNKIDIKEDIDLSPLTKISKWLEISAIKNQGIDEMEEEIYRHIIDENIEDSSQKITITNVRHKSALEKTKQSIENIFETIESGLPMDLMAVDIKGALDSLSEVTGEISSEDLLDHIFSNFCVGK